MKCAYAIILYFTANTSGFQVKEYSSVSECRYGDYYKNGVKVWNDCDYMTSEGQTVTITKAQLDEYRARGDDSEVLCELPNELN